MLDSYCDRPIPDELRAISSGHQAHIADLIAKLRSIGMDDRLIEQSVDQLIASYRAQLMPAIKALKGPYRG